MKQTKKSLLFSALALVLSVSMLIGSTFAWFTDSVTSFANKIQSGTLKVDLELLDKETGEWNSLKATQAPIFDYDKWEPGYVDTKILKVENEGNLALKWVAKFYSEKQLSILADVIDVYVRPSESEIGYPANRSLEGYTCVGSLKTFINSIEETTQGTLEAKQAAYLGIALKMREEAGNEYQNLSLGGAFDIRIFATQHTSESDSFGNQYDKNSLFEDFVDKSILTSQGKYLNDGADSVNFSIYHKGERIVAASVPASAIANKDKPVTITIRAIDSYIEAGENTQSFAYDIDVTNLKSNLKGDQLVTVVIAAPKGLASIKAYHKNELLTDAVYDEVEGTITFKTASFSPFEFTTQTFEVSDLAGLREKLQIEGAYVKLTNDIIVNLTKDAEGNARDSAHAYPDSNNPRYYNGVKVEGKNVALDLNGHSITAFCGNEINSNIDVGALFFVAKGGSLNICDTVGGGYIKMASSIYAVWSPYNDGESYVDIYCGAFIADSYAGDPVGTSTDPGSFDGTMANENSNRALIYAGFGGNINVYGGYFLYNNTPNDIKNRNNGAFNAKDFYNGATPLITIHEGVYLSNKEYRQNPEYTSQPNGDYDNFSVVLSQYAQAPEEITESITIAGQTYSTWYKVAPNYAYKVVFKSESSSIDNLDVYYAESNESLLTVDNIDNDAFDKLDNSYKTDFGGWVTAGSKVVETIKAGNTTNYILYPSHKQKITVRFVDQQGNIVYEETIEKNGSVSKVPNVPYIDGLTGTWEEGWVNKVTNAEKDVTVYPIYSLDDSKIKLIPVDADQDGVTEKYQVGGYGTVGATTIVEIPAYVNGVPVTEVNADAFSSYDDLHSVVIPATVTILNYQSFTANQGSSWSPKKDQITIYYEGDPETWNTYMNEYSAKNYEHLKQGWDNNVGDGSRIFFIVDGKVDNTKYWEYDGSDWVLHNHAYSYDAAKTCSHGEKSHYEYGGGFIGIGASLQKDKFTNYAGVCTCDTCDGATRPDAQYWNQLNRHPTPSGVGRQSKGKNASHFEVISKK